MVNSSALEATVRSARHALGEALLPRYARQPHLSLAYRGLCAMEDGQTHEFSVQHLQTDLARLQALRQPPFTVQLHGVGSFTTVPYLAVGQGSEVLSQVHDALQPWPPVPAWNYVPHVTLGHYARSMPLLDVIERLQGVGVGLAAVEVPVHELALVRYATSDIAGPLVVEGVWNLERQTYEPQADALLTPAAAA